MLIFESVTLGEYDPFIGKVKGFPKFFRVLL